MDKVLVSLLFCTLLLKDAVLGFNADLGSIKSFSVGGRPNGDYFGYSVALHKNDQGNWLLVGAPLSKEGSSSGRPGNVYQCPLSTVGACNKLNIDSSGTDQDRSSQWLGSNIYSGGPNKNVVTCAPRFKDTPPGSVWLHGRCILLDGKGFTVRKRINPCQSKRTGNLHYGYCQAGLGAAITGKGGPFLLMGLPGYGQTTGRLGMINIDKLKPSGDDTLATTSIDRLDLGDTMGYAVSWGNFSGGPLGDIVGGAPRSSDLKGKKLQFLRTRGLSGNVATATTFDVMEKTYVALVIVYSLMDLLPIIGVLENPDGQIGSFFGATTSAVDLNNDGRADLLVGAPLHSEDYEEGKVYVYLNNGQGALNLATSQLAPDKRPGARFGTSMAQADDLNKDGYQDVIIGAPFGGTDGKGAVYIYHGGPDGFKNSFKPIQTIQASDVPGKPTAFGISLAGGVDIDNNGYADFAIGSYTSENAHVVRSKGVLQMTGSITLNTSKIAVSTNKSRCVGPDNKAYTCIKMDACLTYTGLGVPSSINSSVQLFFDQAQAGEKRAFLFGAGNKKETQRSFVRQLTKDVKSCMSLVLYAAADNVKDFLSPILISMQYAYVPPSNCGASLCPVMDTYLGSSTSTQLLYLKGCGNDDVCNTDLVLEATYALPPGSKEVLFGVVDTFVITATVENKKENAFLAKLLIDFPTDFVAVGAESGEGNLFWDADTKLHRMTVSLGSPFQAGRKMVIKAKFSPASSRPKVKLQKFKLKTTTVSKEVNENNNVVTLQVNAALLADLTITGSAFPDTVYYSKGPAKEKEDVKTISEIGPEINYAFLIQNRGPSPVEKLQVRVSITSMEKNNYLLYLLQANIDGTTACAVTPNPANLTSQIGPEKNETTPNRRRRRSVERLDCRTAICTSFDCKIGRLQTGQSVTLKLKTRIWEHTLKKRDQGSIELIVKSVIEVPKEELEFLRQPPNGEPDSKEVIVRVNKPGATKSSEKSSIPWWVILLAVLGGLLLLAIPTAIMYKRGFFKRDRRIKEITGPSGGAEDVE